jgi:hypothetical protein
MKSVIHVVTEGKFLGGNKIVRTVDSSNTHDGCWTLKR